MIVIDKYKCFECEGVAEEDHHVIPRSMGGTKTVPLCSSCHSKVHGLGVRRDQHRELTTRGLNKKMAFDFHYVWWNHFKCADEDDWKDVDEIASDLEASVATVKNRVKRLKEMDVAFIEELVLPYIGYEYYGTSIFNIAPYDLTDEDILLIRRNRANICKSVEKELGMTI